ncbi:integrase core domain protein [Ancylostoma duodenale]|uniref:RNA-directed DNA polymerase n=1 Tax=Ancylostoma duodenale TaxID=51022 RepID=A0A0C2GZX9_9BILA|nr:integrase core domain protein [Ancylostoma duodenale]
MSRPRRTRRNVRYLTDKYGRSSSFQLVTSESIPLITQLFDTDITNQLPNFRTRPIVKRKILQEIQRWNVTNEDFNKMRRFYNITDPRLIALRTIRYAQYRTKQLQLFGNFEQDRPLNYAEKATRRDLQQGISPVFDEYLNAEFGRASFNLPGKIPKDWYLHVPFVEKSAVQIPSRTTTSLPTKIKTTMPTSEVTSTSTLQWISPTASSRPIPRPTSPPSLRFERVWNRSAPPKKFLYTPPTPQWKTSTIRRPLRPFNPPHQPITIYTRRPTRSDTLINRHPTYSVLDTKTPPYPMMTPSRTTSTTTSQIYIQQHPSIIRQLQPLSSSTISPNQHYEMTRTKRTVSTTEDKTTPNSPSLTETIHPYNHSIRRLFNNICARNFVQAQRLRVLSTVDPTWAARLLLGRTDIAATYTAGQLQVTKCRPVTPTHVYTNHSVNGTCYTLTPIQLGDELWFIIPGTQDLTQVSSTTSCPYPVIGSPRMPQKLLLPNNILTKRARPFLFEAPPLFHHILQHSASSTRLRMEVMQQQQEDIISRLQKRGIIEDTLARIRSSGSAMSRSLRSFYDSATRKLASGVNQIKWSLVHLILWTSLPIIIIVILVAFCIFYVKFRMVQAVSSTATSAVRTFFTRKRNRNRSHPVNVLLADLNPTSETNDRLFVPRVYAVHNTTAGLPYLKVILGDNTVTALLDSGASISYMRKSTLTSLVTPVSISPHQLTASTANGSTIQLQGSVALPVRIGTHSILHRFYIAADQDCPAPLLLGSDFIRNLNEAGLIITIDLHNQILSVGSDNLNLVQLNHITLAPTNTYRVRINGDVTLPKRTTNIVPARIDQLSQPRCTTFLIEDNLRPMDDIYIVGRALVTPEEDGTCLINILNPSYKDIYLPDRMNIAHAYPACASEVQVHSIQTDIPTLFQLPRPHLMNEHCAINSHDGQIPMLQTIPSTITPQSTFLCNFAYIPPEADWEKHIPQLPTVVNPNYDIADEVDLSRAALNNAQKEQLRDIIRYHSKAFVGPDGHLGHYKGPIRHRIDLVDNAVIPTRKIYRVPLEKRQEIERQISEMLEQGIIRESTSPFCAPIVLVKKREANTWRFTIDFRGLNAITKPQQSILPNIQDIIDLCANQCLYSSLDFQQGFHQIPLEEDHCERTAFACFLGAFEYVRMPMGLKGAPATFQRIMDDFKKYIRARVFIYIDDLIITSETVEEHLVDIDEVLTKIEIIGMKLKASKCEFAKKEITFLGFVLSKDGIRPNPEKTEAIDRYPTPKNVTDVKAFLGMCSFFRRFIHRFAAIAAPLTALTKKDITFKWTPECEEAMTTLKKALTTSPILAAPRLGKPFIIETDSSAKGVAGVLKQEQDHAVRIIAYTSRTLNKHESRYPAIELEALGLVFAVQKFRPYIDGAKCTVITDHAPLKALLHRKDLTGRLAKYQIILQEFDITILYRPGKKNVLCDTLSRHLPDAENVVNSIIKFPQCDDLFDKIMEEQNQCPWIIKYKESLSKDQDLPELSEYILINDILYKLPTRLYHDPQLVLPETSSIKNDIIQWAHQSQMGTAHLGIRKTQSAVEKIAIWNRMTRDIAQYVKQCKQCQARKDPSAYRIYEPLHQFEVSTKPWQRVHSDVIGPLPLTLDGNKYILVFVDSFSKYIVAEPLPDQKSNTTAQIFINRFVARFGLPETLVTDQGSNYMSDTFTTLLRNLHIRHRTSTPYHHQSNGQVERANRTIQEQIAIATQQHHDDWDNVLHLIVHAYNSIENSTTKYSPHFLVHGHEPINIFHLALQLPTKKFTNEDDYATHITNILKTVYENVKNNIESSQNQQKHHYDLRKRSNKKTYKIGERVWIRKDGTNKISTRFEGPYTITDVDLPNITFQDGRRERTVHINRTKPCHEDDTSQH